MNNLRTSTIEKTHARTRARAKYAGLHVAALGAAALFASVPASAATPLPAKIVNPATLPDLTVAMAAPSPVDAYQVSSLTVTVSNAAPTISVVSVGTTDTVLVRVDLTGLIAQYAQGPTGFSCQVSNGNANTPWSVVSCPGPVAESSNATITVYFDPAADSFSAANACASWYCGQPAYADASVSYWSGRAERNTANDRAMSRIDADGCIN